MARLLAMNAPLRILVVEDHADLADSMGRFLAERGHVMDFASDGVSGHRLATGGKFDALILDTMLPRMDGVTVCRKLREAGSSTAVVMVTQRDQLEDKLEAFQAGTDDYLVQPFSLAELEARVRAVVRRSHPNRSERLCVSDLVLDLQTMVAHRADRLLHLTRGSLRLLVELLRASPNLVTRDRLEVSLWGDESPGEDALRAQICALRRVVDRPFSRRLIHTVHGLGYRLHDGERHDRASGEPQSAPLDRDSTPGPRRESDRGRSGL